MQSSGERRETKNSPYVRLDPRFYGLSGDRVGGSFSSELIKARAEGEERMWDEGLKFMPSRGIFGHVLRRRKS